MGEGYLYFMWILRYLNESATVEIGAGGGTRTHTTLPSRDFKSLASTSSATSAPLFLIGFSPRGNECFPGQRSRFSKRCKTCSLCVPHPIEGPDDVRLRLDMPGVVLAHALRLVAQQSASELLAPPVRFHHAA